MSGMRLICRSPCAEPENYATEDEIVPVYEGGEGEWQAEVSFAEKYHFATGAEAKRGYRPRGADNRGMTCIRLYMSAYDCSDYTPPNPPNPNPEYDPDE